MQEENKNFKKTSIWSTKKVDAWMKDYAEGILHRESPWLDGVIGLKKPDLPFEYTQEEIVELTKCANDIIYFANKYCYCMQGSKGYQHITLRDYQEDMLKNYEDNRFNITLSCRQIGKTVIAAIFILHNTIFNVDRNVGIAANKFATAVEIMDKIKEMMEYLPFFIKRGIKVNNQAMMTFDNGCRIIAQATTKKSFIGFTIHTLYLDEFAHVEPNVLDEFYENIMPTVSSMEDSKIIITSTPNGYNKFFDIYQGAVDGKNSYNPIRVDWWQVPGRDEAWKEKMIEDCGGEDEFMRQYGNSFVSTGNTLLSPESLEKLQKARIKYVRKDIVSIESNWEDEFENLLWHPDFDVEELINPDNRFVIGVDLAEGGGGDNSILNIFQVKVKSQEQVEKLSEDQDQTDMFQLVQVGRFACNTIEIPKMAKLLYLITVGTIGYDNVRIVMEYNTFGSEMMTRLYGVFGDRNEWDDFMILRFKHNQESNIRKPGLKVTPSNKPLMCMDLKSAIAKDKMIISDEDTVAEFENFCKINNTYRASRGHDDLCMSTVDTCQIFTHTEFEVFMDDLLSLGENQSVAAYKDKLADDRMQQSYDFYNYAPREYDSYEDVQAKINSIFQQQLNNRSNIYS